MILINNYAVVERSVLDGVSNGVGELLKDVNNFSKPDVVVETIANSVMAHLCQVMDFGQSPIRFTPDVLRKIWEASQDETPPHPTPHKNSLT